jgi:hypothetical protein
MSDPSGSPGDFPPGLFSKTFWILSSLFVLGAVGRILTSEEPFDAKRATGEIVLALVGAFIMHVFGLMKGMPTTETLFYGALASLGTIRLLQWLVKALQAAISKES